MCIYESKFLICGSQANSNYVTKHNMIKNVVIQWSPPVKDVITVSFYATRLCFESIRIFSAKDQPNL